MPFNGTGIFVRVRNWVDDAIAGIRIRADFHDIEDDGFAAGLSQCITRDGQSTVMNNIPFNSKRITSLQDPTDPQDGATKAYADLMLPLTGGTITGSLTVTGTVGALGYQCRPGVVGPFGGNVFNFNWTGNLDVWVDSTNIGVLATTAYVEDRAAAWAHAIADPKVNRSGDHMTGGLIVDGELVAVQNYLRFVTPGGPGYIQYSGGTYQLGGLGTIWSTGNLNPVQDGRLTNAGTSAFTTSMNEPWVGAVATGFQSTLANNPATLAKFRYMQLLRPSGWYTVGYNG